MKQGPVAADGRTSFAHGVVRRRPGRKHGKEPAGGEIGGAARVLSYCRSLLLPCLAPDRSSVSTLLSAKSLCKASTSNRAISPLLPSSPSDAFTLPYLFCLVFCIICLLPLPDMWYDLISLAEEKRREEEGADLSSMGNCKSSSRALLGKAHVVPDSEWRMQDFGKTHVPDLEWRINDFSSLLETLLETGAKSATSATFHCSGYNWHLQVIPMHKETGSETPYVALRLMTSQESMVPGHTMHVVFELSMYNHSKGMYYGCKATYNFHFKNTYSKEHCLIPLQELLKSSAFLVDDSCVFGVEILKIDVSSPEKKAVVVQKKATTVQNLFVQKKGFVKGTYTWNMNNFFELDLDHFVRSPTFEVGGHKWYVGMFPRGNKYSTDCLSLYLGLDASDELGLESKKVFVMTLSILDQKNAKHLSATSGLLVFTGGHGWGWADFLGLKKLKDPSGGYVVGSSCVVKADLTIFGSSIDG